MEPAVHILCHANGTCKEVFSTVIKSFPPEMGRFVAIDLPGHGSAPPIEILSDARDTDWDILGRHVLTKA